RRVLFRSMLVTVAAVVLTSGAADAKSPAAPKKSSAAAASPADARPADGTAESGDGCPAPAVIVAKLQARYDTTSAFRADFAQRTAVASVGDSDVAKGTVAFRKPGKMRWNYREPDEQQIISDGTTLWIYQPADQQA